MCGIEVANLIRVVKGLEELPGRFGRGGTNKGLPNGTEVGDKKFYPYLKARLKYVLHEIVPPLEGISHSSKLHATWGHSYSPYHVYTVLSVLLATLISFLNLKTDCLDSEFKY